MTSNNDAEAAARSVLEEDATDADVRAVASFVAEHLPAPGVGVREPFERTEDALRTAISRRAAALGRLGPTGSHLRRVAEDVAEEMRGNASLALREWNKDGPAPWKKYEDPLHYARALAHVFWDYETERREKRLPGLTDAVSEGVLNVTSRGLHVDEDRHGPAVLGPREQTVVRISDALQQGLITASLAAQDAFKEADLKLLGSAYALPMLEYIVELSQSELWVVGSRGIPGVTAEKEGAWLRFSSWAALAKGVVGEEPNDRLAADLRRIAHVLARAPIRWPDGSRSTAPWIIHDDDPRGGRPRFGPTFTIDSRLQTGEAGRARAVAKRNGTLGGREREGYRIVPLVRPRVIAPEPASKPNTLAAQFAYVRHLWRLFVRKGLGETGAHVSEKDRADLADAAQLPRVVEARMPEHLRRQGVLAVEKDGCWAPADAATRSFILDGAARRESRPPRKRRRESL